MSFVSGPAGRGCGARPVGRHRERHHQHRGRPLGVAMEATAGDGDPVESVVDPDMVALFDEFLGREEEITSSAAVPVRAQPYHYAVRDTEHKGLCLRDGRLVATNLQGVNAEQEEPISVVPNPHLERRRCPLIVGIRGGNKALSCGTGPEPRLQLEEVKLLDLFSSGDAAVPYTFYKTFAAPPQPQPGPPAAPAPPPLSAAPGPGQGAGPGPPLPAQVAAAQAQDFDPVQRFRLLIPQLKESLQTLMKVAAQNLVQNSNIDNGQKSADGALQRFDKSLEEFYALCDQLELCLRLAHECLSQSFDSAKHAPALVPAAPKGEGAAGESLPYTQYLPLIKAQIAGAKDIHNALLEGANKITGKLPPTGGP